MVKKPLTDLRRWPGDGFSGQTPRLEFRPWRGTKLESQPRCRAKLEFGGADLAGLQCRAGSAAGWRGAKPYDPYDPYDPYNSAGWRGFDAGQACGALGIKAYVGKLVSL